MKTWMMTIIATLAALMMSGCDEDGTPLSSYSSSDLDAMCVDFLAEMDALVATVTPEQGCSFRAAVETHNDSGDQSDCEIAFQKCLKEEDEGRDDALWCSTNYNKAGFYGCEATVAEFENCLLGSVNEMTHAMKKITCETTRANLDSAMMDWMLPSDSCLDFARQCPNWGDAQ